ncbi:MAG: aminotransferase class V-fold PLP-dependent enzyme [Synergistaceae bacterium]|jgi:selenocysteine lyase/cysteine desulfurase|nr:aminotransferase class V-fold PLP-dependent enzyme [Synergistaceae bacterium]
MQIERGKEAAEKFAAERDHFPVLKKEIYFNTPFFGLVPDYVWQATRDNIDDRFYNQNIGVAGMSQYAMIDKIRGVYAALLNAEPSDIAFGLSSSQMFCALSGNLLVESGDNVVMADNAFITLPFAFNAREADGLEVRMAKTAAGYISAEDLCAHADERTKVIAVNHVESGTGYRIDMEYTGNFCRERGIIFAVDAVQSAGAMRIDVERMKIDFLVGSDYKWLMHFRGVGFAYVRPELRKNLGYRCAGWGGDANLFDTSKRRMDPVDSARRYEYGGFHNIGLYAVSLVIEHYLELGAQDVEDYILSLADYCYEKSEKSECVGIAYRFAPKNRSGIVVLNVPGQYGLNSDKLMGYGIRAAVDGGPNPGHGSPPVDNTIRIGLHYFLGKEDIDKLFFAIESVCKGTS